MYGGCPLCPLYPLLVGIGDGTSNENGKKKNKHKQTNKKHRNETQNKIKNVNSLSISRCGFILAKREKCERGTKANKRLVEASIFFLALASRVSCASLAWVKGTEKSRIPRTQKQQQLCTLIQRTPLYIFLPSLHFCDTELHNCKFYARREPNTTTSSTFSLLS